MHGALSMSDDLVQATADMTAIGFFFLCRPGDYTDDEFKFKIEDDQLFIG